MRPFLLASGFLLLGCASKPVVTAAPVSPVKRIALLPFTGEGSAEATRAFLQALKGGGLEVVTDQSKADALVAGIVSEYQPRRKSTIFLGTTLIRPGGEASTKSANPIFSLHSSQNVAQISAMNPGIPQMVAENAVVGLVIRLQDPSHRRLLWADEFVYEALDVPSALQVVAATLARSLQRAALELK